jgi:septum formation protein
VRLLLASRSPRRAELLTAAGFLFDVVPADVDESPLAGEEAGAYVARVSAAKALAVDGRNSRPIVAADTVVVVDGAILGKPVNAADAAGMLKRLAGRAHEVLTGVTILHRDRQVTEAATTTVRFVPLTDAEIQWYVATGEPTGKAGGYAIQGRASRFVSSIDGSYSNVVGLPISTVYSILRGMGLDA